MVIPSKTCCPGDLTYINSAGYFYNKYTSTNMQVTSWTNGVVTGVYNKCVLTQAAPTAFGPTSDPINCPCCPDNYYYLTGANICQSDNSAITTPTISCNEPVVTVDCSCPDCDCGCGCPPDYSTAVLPVACVGTPCETSTQSDCVYYSGAGIVSMGIAKGDTLTSIITKLFSNPTFALNILQTIGLSSTAKLAFCQLVAACPLIPSTGTPFIGPITVTIP